MSSDSRRAAGGFEEAAMQFDDLAECEIPHQARRRYNSSFFRSTRSAAALPADLPVEQPIKFEQRRGFWRRSICISDSSP